MACKQALHMNEGEGETSYARNSSIQSAEQDRMKPLIEAAIVDLCHKTETMMIADLGCSSGPNALALVSIAVEAIHSIQQPPPEVCVFLNDLPNNDFNTVVKRLVTLRRSNEPPVVMTGIVPGSFYERLFTSGSLHLVCSSTSSLQWLSQVPQVLMRNHIPAYDIDEHARRERLPMVHEAYARQFRIDFTRFLELRAIELAPGGQMVVSIIGRHSDRIASKFFFTFEIIPQILSVMVLEGVIDKAKYDSFYVPVYGPSKEELEEIIRDEGSFSINKMLVDDFTSDEEMARMTPSRFAAHLRAAFEQIVVQHFGEVMDEFVRVMERRWSPEGSLQDQIARDPVAMLALSLTKA
ncbi:unnamed protein product [Alopecurus aequalis]